MPPKASASSSGGGKSGKTPTNATPNSALTDEAAQQAAEAKLLQLRLVTQEPKFKTPAPRGRAYQSACFEDSRIVIVGGWDGTIPSAPEKRVPLPSVELCVPLQEWNTIVFPTSTPTTGGLGGGSMMAASASIRSLTTTLKEASSQQVLPPPGAHPAATQCASTELNGNLYVHGGWTGCARTAVLSSLSLMETRWETLSTVGDVHLPALTFHSISGVGRRLYLYGGNGDGVVENVAAPSAAGGAAAAAPNAASQQQQPSAIVNQSLNGDVYVVELNANGSNEHVVSIAGQHGAPPKRSSHSATVFLDTYIVLFGGRGGADGATVLGDVAIFDTTSNTWILSIKVENSPAVPGPRYGHAACRIEGKGIFIHGGIGPDGSLLADGWLLTMEKVGIIAWKRVLCEGTLLTARCGHAMVNLANSHTVCVLGGVHKIPNTLEQPTPPAGGGGGGGASQRPTGGLGSLSGGGGGKESGRVSPTMSNNSGTAPSKRPTKMSAAAIAAAAAEAQAAVLAGGPLDFVYLDFPDLRPSGARTPSMSSIQGGGHRESISSKVTSIKPHQPLQL